jgi:hypothetical protein
VALVVADAGRAVVVQAHVVAGLVRDGLGDVLLVAAAQLVVEHQRRLVEVAGVVEDADIGHAAAAAVVDAGVNW